MLSHSVLHSLSIHSKTSCSRTDTGLQYITQRVKESCYLISPQSQSPQCDPDAQPSVMIFTLNHVLWVTSHE